MKTISSRHNPLIQRFRHAIREHGQEIVIEGPKQVADAVAAGWTALSTLERDVNVSAQAFDSISGTKNSQGVLGLFARPHATADDVLSQTSRSVAVALDGVQDPGNVGTIIRLAAAFDAAGVLLLPGCADPFGPKAIRSSSGAVLTVPVAEVTAEQLLASRVPIIATAMNGIPGDPPTRGAVLVFGNEGAGVSSELMLRATKLSIPMSSRVESLNVAASAAVLLARSYALRNA